MDLLIFHLGRLEKDRLSIIHLPYGAILLCDFLAKNGFDAFVFNAAAEMAAGKKFSSLNLVEKYNPKVIGFPNLELIMNTIPIEPNSPLFLNPKKYKVALSCKNFKDFLNKTPGNLGYETETLTQKDIFQMIKIFNKELSKANANFKKIDIKNIN